MEPRPSAAGRIERHALPGVAALWLAHLAGLVGVIDPFGAAFDARPFVDQDWGLHYHHLQSMLAFWEQGGRLWGYSPYFMAGYPSNTIGDLSIKLFELATLATPGVEPVAAFKMWAVGVTSLVPWGLYAAWRCFFGSDGRSRARTGALVAAALGTAAWWNSLPREMWFYGMLGFPAASVLALLVLGLFHRVLDAGTRGAGAGLGFVVGCTLLLPLHLQAAVMLVVPGMVCLALGAPPRRVAGALGCVVAALALNAFWLWPFLGHLGDQASRSLVEAIPLFVSEDPLIFIKDYLSLERSGSTFRDTVLEKGLRGTLLLLGVRGLLQLARSGRLRVALPLGAFVVVSFSLTYFGSLLELTRGWQPLRMKVPLDLALALAAAVAIVPEARPRQAWLAPGVLALGLLAFGINVVVTESAGRLRLQAEPRVPVHRVVDWLASADPEAGRVLFEESGDESEFAHGGMYLSAFLPHLTGRQLIGGPINVYADRHHFAEFHGARLFQRDVATLGDDELRGYFRLYNIEQIVTFHPRSQQRFAALPELIEHQASLAELQLLRVKQPRSWFWRGRGRVRAGFDRLECSEVRGEEVILKYHWIEGLRSEPPLEIEPVMLLDDPIPFIRIRRPPERFVLSVGGGRADG